MYRIWKVEARKGLRRIASHTCLTRETRDAYISRYYEEFVKDQDPRDEFDIIVTPHRVEELSHA